MNHQDLWHEFGDRQMMTLARIARDVVTEWPDSDDAKPTISLALNKTLHDSVYRDPIILSDCVQDMVRRIDRIKMIENYPKIEHILKKGFQELCVNSQIYSRDVAALVVNGTDDTKI